ncbi:putative PKS/NRPS-like protein biosynthetic cluster [Pestalotiopsis sp. IQ-011]
MSNPNTKLGLNCPKGGDFYVCDTAKIRFLGCCDVDPCADGSGLCPQLNLKPSSFSSDHYNEIKPQMCVDANATTDWFTCQASPPFMGCCKSNPCAQGECPTKDLEVARLSDDESYAQALIGTATATSSSTASSTPTMSAASESHDGVQLSTGAIVGIAVGGGVLLLVLLGLLVYRCGYLARHRKAQKEAEKPHSSVNSPFGYSPVSPGFSPTYQDSITHPESPPPQGYNPYSPKRFYDAPPSSPPFENNSALGSSDAWKNHPHHGSQISSGTWDSISTAMAQKSHQPISMELDGRETERPRPVSELPGTGTS